MFKGESLMGALVTLRSLRREPDEPSKQNPESKGGDWIGAKNLQTKKMPNHHGSATPRKLYFDILSNYPAG
jgi:hypothetical protein